MPEEPDYWYTLDYDYGVTIYRTREEAEKDAENDIVLGGYYGKKFSGWIGRYGHDPE